MNEWTVNTHLSQKPGLKNNVDQSRRKYFDVSGSVDWPTDRLTEWIAEREGERERGRIMWDSSRSEIANLRPSKGRQNGSRKEYNKCSETTKNILVNNYLIGTLKKKYKNSIAYLSYIKIVRRTKECCLLQMAACNSLNKNNIYIIFVNALLSEITFLQDMYISNTCIHVKSIYMYFILCQEL